MIRTTSVARWARWGTAVSLVPWLLLGGGSDPREGASAAPTANPAATTASPSVTAASSSARLLDVTPTVVTPGQDVTVRVLVQNAGTTPVTPTLRLGVGQRLTTRSDVARHAAHPDTALPVLARASGTEVGPGARTVVTVTLPAEQLRLPRPYGALPVTVTVTGVTGVGPIATFLPYQAAKEYEPLQLGVALPLTTDPDPTLLTGDQDDRTQAWTRMLASNSRLDRVLQAAEATGATLVTDPALLLEDGGTTSPSTPPSADDQDAGASARGAFARRVAAGGNPVWFLPPGDPDVSALTSALGGTTPPTSPAPPATVPGTRRAATAVAWPAGGSSSRVRSTVLATSNPDAILMRESRADTDEQRTGSASRRDSVGRRVLVTDDRLSRDLAAATPDTAPSIAQRALADSIVLLAESPGRSRTVLLLPDRDLDPDPTALARTVRTLEAAPWITPTPAPRIAATAATAEPVVDPTDPPTVPPSPLTRENVAAVQRTGTLAEGLRPSVGGDLFPRNVTATLTSARWRGQTQPWTRALRSLDAKVRTATRGVHVVPSMINFFADHGALQVTVVNDLDVEVHDVSLLVDNPGRSSRLRVLSTPESLTIRPKSRTTVRLDAEAVAAGIAPLTISLRTTDGVPLGQDATVNVRVQPTNGWILLAAGGAVGAIFLFGLMRALRRGRRRVADTELSNLDLD